ncbi:MAG: phosphatase PAP2 family protein [Candidatus Omnitrophica bacterium]|nr:phosphatase PAP2 family protein [Candidatus Omnitrophota bacterium]MCM8791371.1 phosphatase PAP2 family protein [Candidatus Omnitrophota bacterium]
MAELELKLFYYFNHNLVNSFFDNLTPLLTFLGEYNFSLSFALALFLVLRNGKKEAALVLLAALLVSGFIIFILKTAFPRHPPFVAIQNVRQLVEEHDLLHSFPSGHATCAFVLASVNSSYFGRAYLFYPLAIAIAFVRIYSGAHYPSDVVTGAVVGIATGYVLVLAVRRIKGYNILP